jgi:heat-inducible transcriptional repressor
MPAVVSTLGMRVLTVGSRKPEARIAARHHSERLQESLQGVARRIHHTVGPLDARQQGLLRVVIEEFVATAAPVGSQTLVERYPLGVSSATVRSILAELEAAGFLTHPHTSAGRIPTDAGYRYYVESIIDAVPLPPVDQLLIRHQFGQLEHANQQWFRLAATTIASATHAAGLATPAKTRTARIRRIDLVSIAEHVTSLIVVLHDGTIRQVLVSVDEGIGVARLAAAASRLDELAAGRTATELERRLVRLPDEDPDEALVRRIGEQAVRLLRDSDAAAIAEVFSDGLLNVMAAPEFAQADKLRRVFEALENRAYLAELFDTVTREDRVQVFIGRENRVDAMSEVALVLMPYGRAGRAVGVVGVLGPTRMRYGHAIGTVRFVGGLMNELVDTLYA